MVTYRRITAAEWGGTWARPPQHEQPLDPEGFLHHTAGNPMSNMTAEQAFRTLNDYAKNGKGYSFLDYDALVHWEAARDIVTIGEGRGKWMSAATRDRNELGEAVVVFGYFHPGHSLSERPKQRHIEGAARAFVMLVEWGLLRRDFTLLGHRDNPAHPGATGCPGDYWYPGPIAQVQARVAELLGSTPPPPQPTEDDDVIYAAKRATGDTVYLGNRVMCWPVGGPEGGATAWADFQRMVAQGSIHNPLTGAVHRDPVNLPRLKDSEIYNLLGAPRDDFKGQAGGATCKWDGSIDIALAGTGKG